MEQIIYNFQDYKLLVAVIGFVIIIIETFIPALPLVAIIGANAFVLGVWMGFFISWVGSVLGSIALFLLSSKFSECKFIKKINNQKVDNFKAWVKKQGFSMIFITYLCPFIPDFLVTITSGISKMKLSNFVPGMILGKFIMFLVISYIGNDIENFIKSPIKVTFLIVLIIIFWILGNKINKKINDKK
ncbi:TVP38/TMEM64 family protein [Paeniclostridium sp. NSJ-45]|uniref:TVP38/TMEM64 family membrane protein n=1 Tax=Paeniclostridium hominis TaxID=2764329 RepID=A0ABR7K325_9FIRM|nr:MULTISPECIES: VTT domain-containing protein [Paeniclostridium]MBC6003259.1 TVP38/TMEM64 family protein [Paeniclostridium hominis]